MKFRLKISLKERLLCNVYLKTKATSDTYQVKLRMNASDIINVQLEMSVYSNDSDLTFCLFCGGSLAVEQLSLIVNLH